MRESSLHLVEPILRAADILRAFGAEGGVLRVRDVVDRTGLHKATVSRLLRTLVAAGLIERARPTGFRSLTSVTPRRKLRVGYASQDERAHFPAQVTACLRSAAETHGAELLVFDNRFDSRVALRNIDSMVQKGVDVAIVFTTIEAIARTVSSRLQRAGIPMIAVDMPLPGAAFYGANNYEAGWTAGVTLGRFARREWKSQVEWVVLVELPQAGPLPQMRLNGALDGIRDILPGIRERQVVHLDGRNDFVHSRGAVRQWLRTAPPGKCLVAAINDPGALGAIAAFRDAGRSRDCAVAGQNATRAGRIEMRRPDSPLVGSVAFHPERYGAELMRMAIHLAYRRPIPAAIYARHSFVSRRNVDRIYPEDRP